MYYSDPLHIPSANYTVWHDGKEVLVLNKRLLDRQNCWENVDRILELHSERLHLEDMMKEAISEKGAYLESVEGAPAKMTTLELTLVCQKVIIKECQQYNDFLLLCNEYYTLIEYELQDAWGFDRNKNFHRHWNRPGCLCPSMDNEDRYPSGSYIYNTGCALHGYFISEPASLWDKLKNFIQNIGVYYGFGQ